MQHHAPIHQSFLAFIVVVTDASTFFKIIAEDIISTDIKEHIIFTNKLLSSI